MTNIVGVLSALLRAASSLRNVSGAVSDLTEIINDSKDIDATLNTITTKLGAINSGLVTLAGAALNLTNGILKTTDESGNLELLNPSKVSAGLNDVADAEYEISAALEGDPGASSGSAAQLSEVASNIKAVAVNKAKAKDAVYQIKGTSGSLFAVVSTLTGVTDSLSDVSRSLAGLSAAIKRKIGKCNDSTVVKDLSDIVDDLNYLSEVEAGLAKSIYSFLTLNSILDILPLLNIL